MGGGGECVKKKKRGGGWETQKRNAYPNITSNKPLVLVWIVFAFSHGWRLAFLCGSRALFLGSACTDFSKFFFKTESYDIIHTFKNYFVTVFSVFNNKRYQTDF